VAFTGQRRTKLHGTFLSEDSITRLIDAVLPEQNDEWQFQHRYMQVEGMLELATPEIEELTTPVPTPRRVAGDYTAPHPKPHLVEGRDP
jgi:hypothetical protein